MPSAVKLRLGGFALFPRGNRRPYECDLIIDVFDRMDEVEALAPRLP